LHGVRAWAARALATIALVSGIAMVPSAPATAETRLDGLRMSATDARSRLVFELGGPVEHQVFTLRDPHRVVIDITDVDLVESLPEAAPGSSLIRRIRSAPRNSDDLRVVLDLSAPGRPQSFQLEPAGDYGHRLVVDVMPAGSGPQGGESRQARAERPRDIIVAIDPGHGGKDPGAIGRRGTQEKDIVLEVSRRLRDLLADTPGYRPVMTRDRDVYLSLRERMQRARKARADLFVSIHADAFRDPRARGSSVYALSLNGATSEAAKWLADRENSADLIGGVSLDDKDEMVASVLLDLSQTATIESSLTVGEKVLAEMGDVNRLHKRSVQQAGFMVLKAPDIPSILVETAFISNPHEETQLRRDAHQQDLARAIRDGVQRYFERKAPPGTRIYAQNRRAGG
jgi:N-acetylmuramoyl-L-alanine amidase